MKIKTIMCFCLLSMFLNGCMLIPRLNEKSDISYWPTDSWQISTPEEQGISSSQLEKMFEVIDELSHIKIDSVLIIRNGFIVAEKYYSSYTAEKKHPIYSCTKSITSAIVGIALEDRLLKDIKQPINEIFTGYKIDDDKKNITLEDLLTMRSGLDWVEGNLSYQALYNSLDWTAFMLEKPLDYEPGSKFNYCSGCSHLLTAVVDYNSDVQLIEYVDEKFFAPLGITDYYWEKDSKGIPIGGWGLEMRPRDMAKVGYLYLHKGQWDGQQIIPEDWVTKSTTDVVHLDSDWDYGYQWWVNPNLNIFAAQGLNGQKIYVIPEKDMVIVFTADINDTVILWEMVENWIIPAVLE